jgi:predicted extracellular nuclease
VYDGQAGTLDYALASPALAEQVAGFAEWHSNADESPLYDYNLEHERDPARFDAAVPFRASDHDPLLVGLDLEGSRHR